MSSRKFIGVIGAGGAIGGVHLTVAKSFCDQHSDWGLAYCSSNPEVRAGNWSACRKNNLGVVVPDQVDVGNMHVYESAELLLDDADVALVIIAAPTAEHVRLASGALRARKPTLCEKPLAFTGHEVRNLLTLANEMRTPLFCGQILPWFAEHDRALQIVQDARKSSNGGQYGKLRGIELWRHVRYDDASALPENVALYGGQSLDLLVHDAHWLSLALGRPERVVASGQRIGDYVRQVRANFYHSDWNFPVSADAGATLSGDEGFEHGIRLSFEKADLHFCNTGIPLSALWHDAPL